MSDGTDELTSLLDELLAEADNGQNMTRAAMLAERISGLYDTLRAQLSEAQARLAEIERQEPVGIVADVCGEYVVQWASFASIGGGTKLYAAPVSPAAQVAQGVADDAIRQAIARAWCNPLNAHKVMDPDLAEAAAAEVVALLAAAQQQKEGKP